MKNVIGLQTVLLIYYVIVSKLKIYHKAEYVQYRMRFIYLKLSLHGNVVFSVCEWMGNAAYIIFIMWNSISGLDAWYHFRFDISCGVAVMGRGHKKKLRDVQQEREVAIFKQVFIK